MDVYSYIMFHDGKSVVIKNAGNIRFFAAVYTRHLFLTYVILNVYFPQIITDIIKKSAELLA